MDETLIELASRLEHKEGSLYWKQPTPMKQVGDFAGSLNKDSGYIQIGFKRKTYLAHRVAFFMYNGYLPKYVDHINGIRDDQHPENLREADAAGNSRNCSVMNGKNTKYKGIYFNSGKWEARIRVDGKLLYLGRFSTEEDAANAYNKAAPIHHKSFAKLNENVEVYLGSS